ncbi:hypothetical protein [Kribbella sp. NPDC003557]|uniref:hypothetical protein n=1 Tax=Kribbella sp. NPDC003557 TaxID=3154449 RepID=UPI0033BA9DE5
MLEEDRKRAAHRALVDRILSGDGTAPAEQRRRAFDGDELSAPLGTLLDKVTSTPVEVTEADFAEATASGHTEDQLFELVICAVVGQSSRRYEAGLTALAEAISEGGSGHAS